MKRLPSSQARLWGVKRDWERLGNVEMYVVQSHKRIFDGVGNGLVAWMGHVRSESLLSGEKVDSWIMGKRRMFGGSREKS